MHIDRTKNQCGYDEAIKRIGFCLDQLERAEQFKNDLDWQSDLVSKCTIEEVIGALVSAEQVLNGLIKNE